MDATLYCQSIGNLLYLTHTFVVGPVAWYMQTPHMNQESSKEDTSIYSRYSSVWDTARFRRNPFVGWFHWFQLDRWPWWLKVYAGYVFSVVSGPITWDCKKKNALALSSTKAKYQAASHASQETMWLIQILFKVWTPISAFNHTLVQQLECHSVSQRSNSTLAQQTHWNAHALHQEALSGSSPWSVVLPNKGSSW